MKSHQNHTAGAQIMLRTSWVLLDFGKQNKISNEIEGCCLESADPVSMDV